MAGGDNLFSIGESAKYFHLKLLTYEYFIYQARVQRAKSQKKE